MSNVKIEMEFFIEGWEEWDIDEKKDMMKVFIDHAEESTNAQVNIKSIEIIEEDE